MRIRGALLALSLPLTLGVQAQQASSVHPGPNGRLIYAATPTGDHIPDFSYAGYMGGGVAIPEIPVALALKPSGADDTSALQAALDRLASKDTALRAIVLSAGTFHLSETLHIAGSNIVLRGAGIGKTFLELTGKPHLGIRVATRNAATLDEGRNEPTLPRALISTTLAKDKYVPAGSREIAVASSAGFAPGDTLLLTRPITPAYLAFMGMDKLVRKGKPERWVGSQLATERIVAAVAGNTLTLTVPLTDNYDPRFGGGSATQVAKITPPVRLHQVGIEDLTLIAPARSINLGDPHFDGVEFATVEDAWLRRVRIEDATNSVGITNTARRITIDHVDLSDRTTVTTPAKPFGFSLGGTQTLVMNSTMTADKNFFAATQARMQGPNVLLRCTFKGDTAVEPHQRWSTGLLVDNVTVKGGAIDLMNRGEMGSGHGWTIGWSVVWNSSADSLTIQSPPGSLNWAIGSSGERTKRPMPVFDGQTPGPDMPEGRFESPNKRVQPESLYLRQLAERLGPKAVANILP